MSTSASEFIKHTGNKCPVPPDTKVSYRTTNDEVALSHAHIPVRAIDLNWQTDGKGGKAPVVGKIVEYRIVH